MSHPCTLSRAGLLGVFGEPLKADLDVGGVLAADAVAAHLRGGGVRGEGGRVREEGQGLGSTVYDSGSMLCV
jgi:hypothetical protein